MPASIKGSLDFSRWSTPQIVTVSIFAAATPFTLYTLYTLYSFGSKSKKALESDNTGESREKEAPIITGFDNIGNTCFLNSVLQGFSSMSPFIDYVRNVQQLLQTLETPQFPQNSISSTLMKNSLFGSKPSSVALVDAFYDCLMGRVRNPSCLLECLTTEVAQFRGFEQQDAHELFVSLVNLLVERMDRSVNDEEQEADKPNKDERILTADRVMETMEEFITKKSPNSSINPNTLIFPFASNTSSSIRSVSPYQQSPFLGYFAQTLKCSACKQRRPIVHQAFNAISLSLQADQYGGISMDSCLNEYVRAEIISGVNCSNCSLDATTIRLDEESRRIKQSTKPSKVKKLTYAVAQSQSVDYHKICNQPHLATKISPTPSLSNGFSKQPSTTLFGTRVITNQMKQEFIKASVEKKAFSKRMGISWFPRLLCIHLNRLCGDQKISNHVNFPLVLNMAKYKINPEDYLHASNLRSTFSTPAYSTEKESMMYRLRAVVVHHGGAYGGHYTTYRLGSENDTEWLHISDDSVRPATEIEVLNAQAYLLFYESKKLQSSV